MKIESGKQTNESIIEAVESRLGAKLADRTRDILLDALLSSKVFPTPEILGDVWFELDGGILMREGIRWSITKEEGGACNIEFYVTVKYPSVRKLREGEKMADVWRANNGITC